MRIGKAVAFLRTVAQMSQRELAEKAGVSLSYISLIENDKRYSQLDKAAKVAAALDMPLSQLIWVAEDMGAQTSKEYLDSLLSILVKERRG